jgi:hypothetical protein
MGIGIGRRQVMGKGSGTGRRLIFRTIVDHPTAYQKLGPMFPTLPHVGQKAAGWI